MFGGHFVIQAAASPYSVSVLSASVLLYDLFVSLFENGPLPDECERGLNAPRLRCRREGAFWRHLIKEYTFSLTSYTPTSEIWNKMRATQATLQILQTSADTLTKAPTLPKLLPHTLLKSQ